VDLYGFNYLGIDLEQHMVTLKAFKPDGTPYPLEETPVAHSLEFGEEIRNKEMTIQRVDGVQIPLLVSSTPLFDAQGHIMSAIVTFEDITERKQAEESLLESEARFRSVLDNSRDLVYRVILKTGRFEYVSPSSEEILGYSPDELKAMNVTEIQALIHPDDLPAFRAAIRKLKDTGKAEITYRHGTKNGDYIWLSNRMCIIKDSDGSPSYRIGNIRDITEHKKAQEALEKTKDELEIKVEERTVELAESEEKYRSLVDNAGEVIVVAQDGIIKFINRKGLEMTGYRPEEIIGKSLLMLIHPDDREMIMGRYERRITSKAQPSNYGIRVFLKDGSTRWAQISVVSMIWEQRPATLSICTDITERKQAEEALNTSQQKYQALTETTSDFIWETDAQGRYTYCSPQMKSLWGYDPKEWIGKTPFDNMLPEEREQGIQHFVTVAQAQSPITGIEFKSLDSQGRLITIEVSGVPYFDSDGIFSGYRGISRDITERKKTEESLAAANNQLKQYSYRITQIQEEERKRIAYELHDDTAQYLALLKLELDSLVHSGKIQDPEVLKKLEYLEKDAGRAVDDVRRYSHELRPGVLEHLGLQAALEQIAEDFNKLNSFKIEVDVEGDEPILTEDVKLGFFRIGQEAINNIRKHAKASKATISLQFNDNQARMIVMDNGVGFNTHESASRSKGKGSLGLMSMQERANLIGADLNIESELNKGTRVILKAKLKSG
jgi:PAS domain S-box-containing protein